MLAEVYSAEKGSISLTRLPEDLYERSTTYLKSLLVAIENSATEDGDRFDQETMSRSDDYKRAKEILERIYATRERKIVLLALNSSRGISVKTTNMSEQEEDLFFTLKVELENTRDRMIRYDSFLKKPQTLKKETGIDTSTDDFMEGTEEPEEDPGKYKKVVTTKNPDPLECRTDKVPSSKITIENVRKNLSDQEISACLDGYEVIRAVQDIEPFVTQDGITVSMKKEDVATLPEEIAAVLVNGGMARRIGT